MENQIAVVAIVIALASSLVGTVLSVAAFLLGARFLYRFVTAPPGQRAVFWGSSKGSAPAADAADQPSPIVSTPILSADAGSNAITTPTSALFAAPAIGPASEPTPPAAAATQEPFRVDAAARDNVIVKWFFPPDVDPQSKVRLAAFVALFMALLDFGSAGWLALPGPRTLLNDPTVYAGDEKSVFLVAEAVSGLIELGLAAVLAFRYARWAAVILFWFGLSEFITQVDHALNGDGHKLWGRLMFFEGFIVAYGSLQGLQGAWLTQKARKLRRLGKAEPEITREITAGKGRYPWLLVCGVLAVVGLTFAVKAFALKEADGDKGASVPSAQPAAAPSAAPPPAVAQVQPNTPSPATPAPPTPTPATQGDDAASAAFFDQNDSNFAKYVVEPYYGRWIMPSFDGDQANFRAYRTRIAEAVQDGPNFASNQAVLTFGCGMSCTAGFIIDLSKGIVTGLPMGGEDNLMLSLSYKKNSRYLKAAWTAAEGDQSFCIGQAYVLDEGRLVEVGPRLREQEPTDGACPRFQ